MIHRDEWASRVLKMSVGRVAEDAEPFLPSPQAWDFVWGTAPVDDTEREEQFRLANFWRISTRVSLSGKILGEPVWRCAHPDADEVEFLTNHMPAIREARIGRDLRLGIEWATIWQSAWLRDAYDDPEREVLVAYHGDPAVGHPPGAFLIYHRGVGYISADLLLILPRFRGLGMGHSLLHAASGGVTTVKLGTEAENVASLRFYYRVGLIPESAESIFHWIGEGDA